MIVAYIRVSSRSQDDSMQRSAVEREARTRGDEIDDWRAEKRSAKTMDRQELARLREDVRMGRIGKVYVFKLDRLCRTGVADTFEVVKELRRAGCTLVCVADNLTIKPDADDIVSEAYIFALSLAAKLERAAINDRIAAARDRAERAGGTWGRPSRVDRATRERAVALANGGETIRAIARRLHVPRSTIARAVAAARPPSQNGARGSHRRSRA
jgi:DNA invertase Pin-like site-specific DNA recombinase